jgi:hypothetical protein
VKWTFAAEDLHTRKLTRVNIPGFLNADMHVSETAGTTGAGLAAGCPTMTLPFFGDQAFWGEMCRRAGVGPAPVAIENLTQQRLLDGLHMLMQPSVRP